MEGGPGRGSWNCVRTRTSTSASVSLRDSPRSVPGSRHGKAVSLTSPCPLSQARTHAYAYGRGRVCVRIWTRGKERADV